MTRKVKTSAFCTTGLRKYAEKLEKTLVPALDAVGVA